MLIEEITGKIGLDAAWIMPNGKILPVEFMGHSDTYVEWLSENNPKEYEYLKDNFDLSKESPGRTHAFNRGWIRYVMVPIKSYIPTFIPNKLKDANAILSFEYSKITTITATQCINLINSHIALRPLAIELGGSDYQCVSYRDALIYFKSI